MKHGSTAMIPKQRFNHQFGISFIPMAEESLQNSNQDKHVAHSFFNQDDVRHHKFAPVGQTVNNEYYFQVIWHLHEAVCRR
ncbi:hypothetical protein Cfor_11145 [Coptotermes formosanus]|jgi:hypothetical protein|uniref:Uncharacterized protein n=1 Tax=Coptotermes formosanus TaxID=36987 RepID=A0A6L2PI18_COPFO|nr:hypothetical protein Cfor_11145 [Coptotermes formosanus]